MVTLRRAVFYLFLVLYLVICPLTVLYAFGYSLQSGPSGRLVRTGLISISSTPSGADVYLGRRRFTQRTPATIRGLLPGAYDVRLALKGHRSWEASVPVEEERATVLERALLLPVPLPAQVHLAEPFTQVIPVPGHRAMVLARGPQLQDLVVYDWRAERVWPLDMPDPALSAARLVAPTAMRDSAWLLLQARSAAGDHWLWCEPGRGREAVEDLTALFIRRPLATAWDGRGGRYVFAVANGQVDRVDSMSKQVTPRWLEGVEGVGVLGRWVYVLHDDGRLVRTDRDGKSVELLARMTLPNDQVFGAREPWQVHALTPETVLLQGPRGELFSAGAADALAEQGILGVDWDPRHQRALVWERERLGIISLTSADATKDTALSSPAIQWVFERATGIEQAAWVDDGAYILVRDDHRVFLLEPGPATAPRLHDVVMAARNTNVTYAEDSGRVYYLDQASGYLSSMEIVPHRDRLPLQLPEPSKQAED